MSALAPALSCRHRAALHCAHDKRTIDLTDAAIKKRGLETRCGSLGSAALDDRQ